LFAEIDQRYYSSITGRCLTPDPRVNLSVPPTWNRYTYIHNAPVNYIDPSGLDPERGETCIFNGVTYPFSCADLPLDFRRPLPLTLFEKTQAYLGYAQTGLAEREKFSTDCLTDIQKIAGQLDSFVRYPSVDINSIIAAATGATIVNGKTATLPVSALYNNATAGAAHQFEWDRNFGPGQTIAMDFMRNPRGLTAESVLGGAIIYVNPDLIANNLIRNEALLFHESFHLLGIGDDDIQIALGLPVGPDTKNITDKLQKDCFKGKDNY
jgi:hypothetical protein